MLTDRWDKSIAEDRHSTSVMKWKLNQALYSHCIQLHHSKNMKMPLHKCSSAQHNWLIKIYSLTVVPVNRAAYRMYHCMQLANRSPNDVIQADKVISYSCCYWQCCLWPHLCISLRNFKGHFQWSLKPSQLSVNDVSGSINTKATQISLGQAQLNSFNTLNERSVLLTI